MTIEAKADDFDNAFAQFAAPEEKAEDKPAAAAEDKPAEVVEDKPAEAAVEDKVEGTDDKSVEGEDKTAAAAEEKPEIVVEDKKDDKPADNKEADAILDRLARLVKDAPAEEKPAAVEDKKTDEPELYTAEEQAFLENYQKDWGDVFKGESLIRRAENRALVMHVFKEISEYLQPIKEVVDVLGTNAHVAAIEQKIGQFDDKLATDIDTWINKQPTYLQNAYNQVMKEGTAVEVADLVERYRGETGAKGASQKLPEKKDAELSDAAKKAAASLAPVRSDRSVVEHQEDTSNFDAAWSKFADSI